MINKRKSPGGGSCQKSVHIMRLRSIAAIILAAGYSTRFEGFKPLANIGGKTLVDRAIALFKSTGIEALCIVVGHRRADIVGTLNARRIPWAFNEKYRQGMGSSVRAGVAALSSRIQAFFVLPVDIPLVRRQTVLDLLNAYKKQGSGILYPVFDNKRGHPPLISRSYAGPLLAWHGRGGLKSFLELHEEDAADVPVADQYIHRDVDIPDDLEALRAQYARYEIPSVKECLALLQSRPAVSREVREHCAAVASAALRIGSALKRSGHELDLDSIVAGALLHDIAKGSPDHARAGGRLLRDRGFYEVARIVEAHMEIRSADSPHIYPDEVVYLADKLIEESRYIPLITRRRRLMNKLGHDIKACAAVHERIENAKKIQRKIEKNVGKTIQEILKDESGQISGTAADDTSAAAWRG